MDDGKRTSFALTRASIRILICLFLIALPAGGAPTKDPEAPAVEKSAEEKEPAVVAASAAVIDSFTGDFSFPQERKRDSISGQFDEDPDGVSGNRGGGSR